MPKTTVVTRSQTNFDTPPLEPRAKRPRENSNTDAPVGRAPKSPQALSLVSGLRAPASASMPPGLDVKKQSVVLDAKGNSAPISVTLPPDAVSVSVFIQGPRGNTYLVTEARLADETSITSAHPAGVDLPSDDGLDAGPRRSPNPSNVTIAPGAGQYLVPNNPQVVLQPGPFSFEIRGWQNREGSPPFSGPVNVTVAIKRGPSAPRSGQLDVHIYLSGHDGFTEKSEVIQGAVKEMQRTFKEANISTRVTYQRLKVKGEGPVDENEMADLTARGKHTTGIGVYVVSSIFDSYSNFGMSLGAPIPAPLPGQPNLGVCIATQAFKDHKDPEAVMSAGEALGNTMAHEIGHGLGLPHTENRGVDDPFPDTNFSGPNVMHAGNSVGLPGFSRQQAWALLRSPVVHIESSSRSRR